MPAFISHIQRCTYERARETLDLDNHSEDLACKLADQTLHLVQERCLELDPKALDEAVLGLQQLRTRLQESFTEELGACGDHASHMIALLQEGLIQHDLLKNASNQSPLAAELTHCTRAHGYLKRITWLSDGIGSLSVHHARLLAAADNAAMNARGVVDAVYNYHELPVRLHGMARRVMGDDEAGPADVFAACLSDTVVRLLCCASSCAVTAGIAYRAQTQVAASQDVTEKYLFDFRLVWRCILEQMAVVMGSVALLCTTAPGVIVDAIRAARVMDSVVEEIVQHLALQCALGHHSGRPMCSEIMFLGIDQLACRPGLPDSLLEVVQQLLEAVAAVSGEHAVCVGNETMALSRPGPVIVQRRQAISERSRSLSSVSLDEACQTGAAAIGPSLASLPA
eukprot:jgi/Ulvmu1/5080/UM021_0097.1